MDIAYSKINRLCLSIIFALAANACGSYCPPCAKGSENTAAANAEKQAVPVKLEYLVGLWRGYWSPKGKVETERYLFLSDGRWGWLAVSKEVRCLERGVAQRSGKWSIQGNQLVLEESQRKEVSGCKNAPVPKNKKDKSKLAAASAECREPELQTVNNPTAVVERVLIDQCPPNQEAEQLDSNYACVSIGGKAFWRQKGQEEVEKAAFFDEP